MPDYNAIAQRVMKKIEKYGRPILLETLYNTAPIQKPWAGNEGGDPSYKQVNAVFVPPKAVSRYGLAALSESNEYIDFTVMSDQVAIIGMVGLSELTTYHKITDNGVFWKIVGSQVLRPGAVPLLGYIGVRR